MPINESAAIAAGKTVVASAEGELKVFSGALSKFIVAHPKTAVILAALTFGVLGYFVGHI
ncbi:MAG: hypothetical protein P4L73_19750 [Caulobacteraceae bacterium]|nr:hypothetical protein [Caulobacteraceae bacterium]